MKMMKFYFRMAVIFWTIFSGTFLIMPFTRSMEKRFPLVLMSFLFWISLAAGLGSIVIVRIINKKVNIKNKVNKKKSKEQKKTYKNIPKNVADVVFIISIFLIILISINGWQDRYIMYITISMLIDSIGMHFVFEDSLYKRIINNKGVGDL